MKKKLIVSLIITLVLLVICLTILFVGLNIINKNKPHKYSDIISTKNISYVEYNTNNDFSYLHDFIYNREDYITLTDIEKEKFINSINSDSLKFKYFNGGLDQYKGLFYNTFIIHYSDESITYFDKNHVEKLDKSGKSIYFKILDAYECSIWENLFK